MAPRMVRRIGPDALQRFSPRLPQLTQYQKVAQPLEV
jgi:hypothetical protein